MKMNFDLPWRENLTIVLILPVERFTRKIKVGKWQEAYIHILFVNKLKAGVLGSISDQTSQIIVTNLSIYYHFSFILDTTNIF